VVPIHQVLLFGITLSAISFFKGEQCSLEAHERLIGIIFVFCFLDEFIQISLADIHLPVSVSMLIVDSLNDCFYSGLSDFMSESQEHMELFELVAEALRIVLHILNQRAKNRTLFN